MASEMELAGITVTSATEDDVLARIDTAISRSGSAPLAIGSVNLDHLHHFPGGTKAQPGSQPVDWLWLADGMPIAWRGRALSGQAWPRVTGADLLPAILERAESAGARVGWLGGTRSMHEQLAKVIAQRWPRLDAGSVWAPMREDLDAADSVEAITEDIAAAQVDILVVALGKPRQEQWIDSYGALSDARVLLAFGASGDFLAGQVARAPEWMQKAGAEWLYRLYREPRRLARRYLIEGPQQFNLLRKASWNEGLQMSDAPNFFTHSHALCESVNIGQRTRIWAFAHVLPGASVGADCNVCDHAFIESDVVIGDRVTVKNRVLIFDGVTVEDDVFLGPAVVFTNDLRPRAEIKKSGNALTRTLVRRGASLGAGVVVVAGHTLGKYSFTGAGAVIVSDLAPHGFYVGNPARRKGWVCRCGDRLDADLGCRCGRSYRRADPDTDIAGLEEVQDER